MIAAIALLFLAQADAGAAETPRLTVEEGPDVVFTCGDADNNKAEIETCEAEAAAVAAEPPEPDDDCDDPQTQQRMNFCASLDFGAADAALNEQWAITAREMRDLDDQIDRDEDHQPGHFETLLAGQRAWLAFRDAQCRSESFFARGGSMQPMLELQCKAYMTELRIQQLRNLSAGPES